MRLCLCLCLCVCQCDMGMVCMCAHVRARVCGHCACLNFVSRWEQAAAGAVTSACPEHLQLVRVIVFSPVLDFTTMRKYKLARWLMGPSARAQLDHCLDSTMRTAVVQAVTVQPTGTAPPPPRSPSPCPCLRIQCHLHMSGPDVGHGLALTRAVGRHKAAQVLGSPVHTRDVGVPWAPLEEGVVAREWAGCPVSVLRHCHAAGSRTGVVRLLRDFGTPSALVHTLAAALNTQHR